MGSTSPNGDTTRPPCGVGLLGRVWAAGSVRGKSRGSSYDICNIGSFRGHEMNLNQGDAAWAGRRSTYALRCVASDSARRRPEIIKRSSGSCVTEACVPMCIRGFGPSDIATGGHTFFGGDGATEVPICSSSALVCSRMLHVWGSMEIVMRMIASTGTPKPSRWCKSFC